MGAPIGNQNARKGTEVSQAVRRALASDNWRRLRQGAERLAEEVSRGTPWAWQMIWDRMEGKVPTALHVSSEQPHELTLTDVLTLIMQARTQEAQDVECVSLPGADENHSRSDPAARLDPPIPQIGEAGGVVDGGASPTIAAKNEEPE